MEVFTNFNMYVTIVCVLIFLLVEEEYRVLDVIIISVYSLVPVLNLLVIGLVVYRFYGLHEGIINTEVISRTLRVLNFRIKTKK